MAKDRRRRRRRRRAGELEKRAARVQERREAWKVTGDGAGPRDIDTPERHHRR